MTSHDIWAGRSVTSASSRMNPAPGRQPADSEPDARIVALFAIGDERALAQLFMEHGSAVYKLAYSIGRDHEDAEDVVNFTFAKAWRERARFDTRRGSVVAWLCVIGRNKAFDIARAKKRRDHHTTQFGIETHAAAQSYGIERHYPADAQLRLERIEIDTALHAALAALPPAQREVIELAYLGDYSHTDVAVKLGLPLGTVKTRARMALRRMRSSLGTETVRL